MFEINSITSNSKQRMTIPLDNGDIVNFNIYYMPTQYSWYYDFEYKNYVSNGNKVVLSPNALRHLRNIIPFGFAFVAEDKIEPFNIDDFESGRVIMYVLNKNDVAELEGALYG